MKLKRLHYILLLFACLLSGSYAASQNTIVTGRVTDAATGEALPFVNVSTNANSNTTIGSTTDLDGHFRVQAPLSFDTIVFQFVGYTTLRLAVTPRTTQNVRAELHQSDIVLQAAEIVGKRSRYSRKNNPAVELMDKVIGHKDSNSISRQDYYEYRTHEKIELSLLNINDSLRYQKRFQKFGFLFDNVQTSTLSGKKYLPLYFMESLTDRHYRKDPTCAKSMLLGQKDIKFNKFLEPQSIDYALHDVFGDDINVYDNYIHIVNNELMSPLAYFATRFYHYYIDDTLSYQGDSCIQLSFTPSNVRDIGFSGHLLVAKDSSYAVRAIHLEVPTQSGLNFVNALQIDQSYDRIGSQLVLTQNKELMEGNVYGVQMHGKKEIAYGGYAFGKAMPDDFYTNNDVTQRMEGFNKHPNTWWDEQRVSPLSASEQKLYDVPQQLNSITTYRLAVNTLMAFVSGYIDVGKIDLGPLENTISWNDVEGLRLRAGGKTNIKLNPHWFANGFVAYGTKDQRVKYNAEVMYNFADKLYHQWEFPVNLLTVGVEHNTEIPGQTFLMGTYDRLTLSLNRGDIDMMVMNHRYYAEYWYETMGQLSAKVRVEHRTIEPLAHLAGTFHGLATLADGQYAVSYDRDHPLTVSTAGFELRYAKNEKFYQSQKYRTTINCTTPILTLNYTYGAPLLGADYSFHKIQLMFQKRWYVWSFGYADVGLQAGAVIGEAAYPLLFVHQANQNWAYQDEAFNMMNYFEFVSDHYLQAILNYNFNGYIFNRIPLLRRLGWREAFAVKSVWGGISKHNMPTTTNNLIDFARDGEGNYKTYTLDHGPYVEANVGIDNIFKVLRVDFVHRFTYLDHPGIAKNGVRLCLHIQF